MWQSFVSEYNGQIKLKSFLWQKSVWIGGVEQSGPLVEAVWKKGLEKVSAKECHRVLILGLGCGLAAKLVAKKFPVTEITGVEIDPVMIDLGKKYFGLDKIPNLEVVIADAKRYQTKHKFDLILVDAYKGQKEASVGDCRRYLKKGGEILINYFEPEKNFSNRIDRITF